jgi:SAM-dependent methyltransferase
MTLSSIERWYPESRFGGFTDIDGTVRFYARLQALLSPDDVVVDVGCGRGAHTTDPIRFRRELRKIRGKVARVIGIDVEDAARVNPWIDEFRKIGADGAFPLEDASCDALYSDSVLEHVSNPDAFFGECARILKPNGLLALRTTNSLGYVALGARIMPRRLHVGFLLRAQTERRAEDMFPPVYACNTRRKLRRALVSSGFDGIVYTTESEPRYFLFSRALYALAVLHQRFAPSALRLALFAFARRVETP